MSLTLCNGKHVYCYTEGSPLLSGKHFNDITLIEHDTYYDWVHPIKEVDQHFEGNVTPGANGRKKRCCVKG